MDSSLIEQKEEVEESRSQELMELEEFKEKDLDWASCEDISDDEVAVDDDMTKNTVRYVINLIDGLDWDTELNWDRN